MGSGRPNGSIGKGCDVITRAWSARHGPPVRGVCGVRDLYPVLGSAAYACRASVSTEARRPPPLVYPAVSEVHAAREPPAAVGGGTGMQRPQGLRDASAPVRKDRWAMFRGLAWWQLVLSLLPVGLIPLGGLIGGLFGGAAVAINVWLARRQLGAALQVMAMLGVSIAAYVLWFVVARAILGAVA